MPKITIREKDLTSAGNLEATTNAVYIPGYANMGPVNKPTLCETVNDFYLTFGSEPYRFREDQPWQFNGVGTTWSANAINDYMGHFYQAGDYEKSYAMAIGLLKLGMPVLYERVFNKGDHKTPGKGETFEPYFVNEKKWTAKKSVSSSSLLTGNTTSVDGVTFDVVSTSPGLVGMDVYFIVTQDTVKIDNVVRDYYIFEVGRNDNYDLGTSEIPPVKTYITFDRKVAQNMPNVILVSKNQIVQDQSGLVQIHFDDKVSESASLCQVSHYDNTKKEYKKTVLNIGKVDEETWDPLTLYWKDEFNVKDMYDSLVEDGFDSSTGEQLGLNRLLDKGEYVIKYITSGAYPTLELLDVSDKKYSELSGMLIKLAADRGDCTALIDHTPNNQRPLVATSESSVYYAVAKKDGGLAKVNRVNSLGEDANTFASMYTPYGIYETSIGSVMLPASYGYLVAMAIQAQSSNNWLATAGVTRGQVPGLKSLCQNVTNAMADSYQPRNGVAINAITNIKPYGLVIWGARTLKDNVKKGDLTATSFMNIRQLTNDVKRQVWVAAKTLTYEQNNDILWIKFKNKITPLLDNMINGNGISAYEIKRQSTTKKATVKAVVRLYAIEPVEDWDITIELADSTTEILG